jgi:hypothetical protein
MSIELMTDKILWDRFIEESPNATLFHKWDFLKIVEKYTGYRMFPYGVYKEEELVSVIPLFYKKKKGLKFVYSPPQTTLSYIPYMGFALCRAYDDLKQREKETALSYILRETGKALRSLSPNYISLAVGLGDMDIRPYIWHGYEALLQYTYTIDLDKPLKTLWEDCGKKCRKEISSASKLDPSIERAYDSEALFNVMRGRLTNVHGGDTFFHQQSPDYLKAMLTAFPQNIKMYFMYSGGLLIGAKVDYGYKDRYMSWMGDVVANDDVSANEYFHWELIKKAKEAGYKKYEILGADEKRLNRFKTKFNPSPEPYFYVIKKDILYRTASYGSERIDSIIGKKDHRAPGDKTPKGTPEAGKIEV